MKRSPIFNFKNKKSSLLFYITVLFFAVILILRVIYEVKEKGDYNQVMLSSQFDEDIQSIYHERSFLYLKISNREKKVKIKNSCNYDYSPHHLIDFLKIDDRLIKNKCSDTIHVIRNNNKYHFLIGDVNYNNPKRSKKFIEKYRKERAIIKESGGCN